MTREIKRYVRRVMQYIPADRKTLRRIEEDLTESLTERMQNTPDMSPEDLMGDPEEVAREFAEGLQPDVPETGHASMGAFQSDYTSSVRLFGLPLVHIARRRNGLAVGWIAVGPLAFGFFALGGFSVGVFSFGGLGLGLLMAFGGLAASGGISIGGLALAGVAAFGGAAIASELAIGGFAQARVAVGDETHGLISLYEASGTGDYLLQVGSTTKEQLRSALDSGLLNRPSSYRDLLYSILQYFL